MAFKDLLAADMAKAVLGGNTFEDTAVVHVDRHGVETTGAGQWSTIESEGFLEDSGPKPVQLLVSKATFAKIVEGEDRFKLGGRWYRAKVILNEDSAAWELYCAPAGKL